MAYNPSDETHQLHCDRLGLAGCRIFGISSLRSATMPASDLPSDIDWSLTTWEGARREQLRRWAALPLENIVAALEEMDTLARQFASAESRGR